MSDNALGLSHQDEHRIQSLETGLTEIHRLLSVIQTRLLGSIESDKPGLISDFKELQEKVRTVEGILVDVKQNYVPQSSLALLRQELSTLKDAEIAVLKKSVENLWRESARNAKFRWLVTGGLIVVNAALGLYVALKH